MYRTKKLRYITLYVDEPHPIVSYSENKFIPHCEVSNELLIRSINKIGDPEDNEECVFIEGQTEVHRYVDVLTLFKLTSFTTMYHAPKLYEHLNRVIDNGNAVLELTFKEYMEIQQGVLSVL